MAPGVVLDGFSHAHQGLQTWILSLGQGLQCHDQLEDGEFNHKRSRQSTNSLLYVLDGKILGTYILFDRVHGAHYFCRWGWCQHHQIGKKNNNNFWVLQLNPFDCDVD